MSTRELNTKAIIIQKNVRCWLERKRYQTTIRRIIIVQSLVRKWIARRLYKKLKLEARSLEHVKKLNKGLENKIISLQQRIEELVKENNILKSTQHELAELCIKLDYMKGLESDVKRKTITLNTKEKELDTLLKTLEQERDEKMDIMNEKERIEKERKGEMEKINNENVKLKAELDEMNEKMKSNQIGAEEILKSRLEEEKRFLIREHDQDRDAYQKLLADYNYLEQRHEARKKQLSRLQRGGVNASGAKKGHQRSLSNASTASATSELPDDDYGYGSVRSTGSHQKLDNIDWNQQGRRSETVSPEGQRPPEQIDVGLVLKLQQKLKDVEKKRNRLQERVEYLEKDSPSDDTVRTHDACKLQELEMENAKLKTDLATLRKVTADGETGGQELLRQLEASQLELDRRREECIQLHSVLANQTKGLKSVASNNYSSHVDIINEDGELVLAFEAQKKINRQLEDELQSEKTRWQAERKEFLQEIERLKEDNDRQQKLLSVNLTMSPQTQTEAFMQHEITRLASENLDLQEKYDALSEQCRKYRKQMKLLAKKLKDVGVVEAVEGSEAVPSPGSLLPQDQHSNLPVMRKKERDYMGMFDYQKEDELVIVKHLIYDLKPRVAMNLLPGLPAYILFMCIRHTDYTNDDEKVRSLLTVTINTIKKVIKKRHEDLDTTVLWLSNTLRLLHNLKQYSGDKSFQSENTLKQNDQCLRNFDLSEYRQVLSDIAVWIYQGVIHHLEERVQPMIVPAILEHEAISGLSGQNLGGMRGRASSVVREPESPVDIQKALDTLLQELTAFHRSFGFHGVDPELIVQVFRQLFYFICASSLNNLLLRKDLCHWTKGMQIRYNLSHLEQWIRDQRMQDTNVPDALQPIIQAAQLLQARKRDEDVQSVCDICDKLSRLQIIKILNLYTPADEFEERVPESFIRKIQTSLQERAESQEQAALLMDTKFSFPVRFPFNPSNIRLEDIEIPECLNLPVLKKV